MKPSLKLQRNSFDSRPFTNTLSSISKGLLVHFWCFVFLFFTLFNLQGTHRSSVRQGLNCTTLGKLCQELFSESFAPSSTHSPASLVLSSKPSWFTRTHLSYHSRSLLSSAFFTSFISPFLPGSTQQLLCSHLTRTHLVYHTLSALSRTFFRAAAFSQPRFPSNFRRRLSAQLIYQIIPSLSTPFLTFFVSFLSFCFSLLFVSL